LKMAWQGWGQSHTRSDTNKRGPNRIRLERARADQAPEGVSGTGIEIKRNDFKIAPATQTAQPDNKNHEKNERDTRETRGAWGENSGGGLRRASEPNSRTRPYSGGIEIRGGNKTTFREDQVVEAGKDRDGQNGSMPQMKQTPSYKAEAAKKNKRTGRTKSLKNEDGKETGPTKGGKKKTQPMKSLKPGSYPQTIKTHKKRK